MRIMVDARELEGRRTGVGRYLHELLRALSNQGRAKDHEFVLCAPTTLDTHPYTGLRIRSLARPGQGLFWEQVVLAAALREERPDLLFAPGYTAPLCTLTPTVLVIHDVSFASRPEWFSWREGARRRTFTRLAARRAARVVTVSRFSKSEIESYLGIAPGQIVVIPNGVTRMTAPRTKDRGTTVLYVGSIFNRRNVPTLIDAVALLVRRGHDLHLEIVGDNRTNPHIDLAAYAVAASVADRVRIRSYVNDEELATCYAGATVFAFLSEYEGFGLTPLEALSAGIPPLLLDRPTTREVYGDAATFVADLATTSVADALARVLFDPTERERVLLAGTAVLSRHSWESASAQLLDVFDAAAGTRVQAHAII